MLSQFTFKNSSKNTLAGNTIKILKGKGEKHFSEHLKRQRQKYEPRKTKKRRYESARTKT